MHRRRRRRYPVSDSPLPRGPQNAQIGALVRTELSPGAAQRLKVTGEALENALRCLPLSRAHVAERCGHGGFDGAASRCIHAPPARGEAKDCASSILRVRNTLDQSLRRQPRQHARQRARVHVHGRRQVPRGQPRKQADDTQCQALRPGDANFARHALGGRFESVHNRPQQLHELQYVRQRAVGMRGTSCHRCC